MSASQRANQVISADREAVALAARSPRRFAAGLGLLVALAALIATLRAATASAYECYRGYANCEGQGPLQHLEQGAPNSVLPTTTTYFCRRRLNTGPPAPV